MKQVLLSIKSNRRHDYGNMEQLKWCLIKDFINKCAIEVHYWFDEWMSNGDDTN